MAQNEFGICWARKVRRDKIRRLYEDDAKGFCDEELINEVGWSLFARCQSIIEVTEATNGRAKCHQCGNVIRHSGCPNELLRCEACGWEIRWELYHRSYQGRQLFGGAALSVFQEFVRCFPLARSPREKLVLIDRLIHSFHWFAGRPCRPAAANLLEGTMTQVIEFLNSLTYGPVSSPELRMNHELWQAQVRGPAGDR
ncbi:MAG: hypothetical protein ACUVTZ_07960 [Armatimonadota bacterium]